jgi:hypothetical protein
MEEFPHPQRTVLIRSRHGSRPETAQNLSIEMSVTVSELYGLFPSVIPRSLLTMRWALLERCPEKPVSHRESTVGRELSDCQTVG